MQARWKPQAKKPSASNYDESSERLRTVRNARMPEVKKQTLKRQLVAEVENDFQRQPNLRLVKVADGARDSWDFLAPGIFPSASRSSISITRANI